MLCQQREPEWGFLTSVRLHTKRHRIVFIIITLCVDNITHKILGNKMVFHRWNPCNNYFEDRDNPHGSHTLCVLSTCKHFSPGLKFSMPLGSIKSAACDKKSESASECSFFFLFPLFLEFFKRLKDLTTAQPYFTGAGRGSSRAT